MTYVTHNLELSEAQAKLLLEYGVDVSIPNNVYIIEGKSVHNSFDGLTAYFAGQYIFFLKGSGKQQLALCKAVCKTAQEPILKLYHAPLRITAYATPLEQYQTESNLVSVVIGGDSDVNLAHNLL